METDRGPGRLMGGTHEVREGWCWGLGDTGEHSQSLAVRDKDKWVEHRAGPVGFPHATENRERDPVQSNR